MLLQLRLPRVVLAALVGAGAGHRRRRLPGRVPQPAGRPVPARRGRRRRARRHPGHRLLARAVARAGRDRAAGRVRRRAGRGRLRPGRWAPRPAARTAPPCCSPASPSPPSSPPAQTLVQQQNTDDLRAVYGWLLGQLGRAQWSDIVLVLPYLGAAVVVLLLCGRALDVLAVGDDEAASLGVHPGRLRLLVILAASLATAAAVAVSGLIGFVGLVVPHIARRLVGGSHRAGAAGLAARRRRRSWCSPTSSPASSWRRPSCRSGWSPRSSARRSSPACCWVGARRR